jgi:type IV pilus assembly protein PilY1
MRMVVTLLRRAGYSATIAAAVAFSAAAPAAPLGLTDSPLFLAAGVQPNLIMAIDDSGSMDFEVLFPGNDGSAWWRRDTSGSCGATDNNSFTGCVANSTGSDDIYASGRLNFNNSGNANDDWKKYAYLFPNGTGGITSARRRSGDSDNDHFAIPPIPAYAWARSPTHNKAYFNPSSTYVPWVNGGGYTFTDATPTATRFDPVFESTVTIDLTRDYAGQGNADTATACSSLTNARTDHYLFKTYAGMTLPEGTCFRAPTFLVPDGPDRGNDPDVSDPAWQSVNVSTGCQIDVDNGCSTAERGTFRLDSGTRLAIRYFPATFYLPATTALPADYGFTGTTLTGKAPDGTDLTGYQIKSGNFATTAQYNAAIQNFANWFQYYRKRHQALRGGLGESFSDLTGIRVDGFTINNARVTNNGVTTVANVTMGSIDTPSVKTNLYSRFYYDWVRTGGTPNRSAVAAMIQNFKRTDSDAPVTSACQKNFGMLFTDGFSNSPADNDGIRGVYDNVDGSRGTPYADTYTGSLADAVMSAYVNPLRTGADFPEGKLTVPTGCGTGPYSGPLDCNRNLHMNFYAVTLGTRGLQFNSDSPVDPYTTAPTWPTSFPARHPSAVDDLWHAAVNGRGQLLNARSPQEISDKLGEVLSTIINQTASASSASINSGSISSDSRVFQARFDSASWTGQLISYAINTTNGQLIGTSARDAADALPAPDARNIFTRNSTGQAVDFTWAALQGDATRVQDLDPASDPTRAQAMLNYLRGNGSNEPQLGDTSAEAATRYRARKDANGSNKLGDIISSAPLFIGAPPFRYRDSLEAQPYSDFASDNADRRAMVYVGANDGMLHAFYADGANVGAEAFAYVPGAVFPRLRNLAAQDYTHQYYVDGSPAMGDAFFGRGATAAGWHTVLAGGLNKGGQAVYAIDVTDPTTVGASSLLWEFSDTNDPDLGFTFSQPSIVKLRDGEWYVVFGNGYNSTLPDGRASTTGNAVLFIVNIATGVARKLDTGVGYAQRPTPTVIAYDNGLATPSLVDVDGDRVVEYAYAGDLYGNMWKFDLTSASPDSWNVAFSSNPLYQARDSSGRVQPITVRPEVARGPQGNGVMVLFGTGKYLEATDKSRTPRVDQSFYGIVDRNSRVTYTGNDRTTALTQQLIHVEDTFDMDATAATNLVKLRVTSNRTLGANSGWYMDLISPVNGYEAEKQVTNPVVRNGAVIFTTLIPDSDPCGAGGSSWLMELDLLDGSRLEASPFDLTRDGEFTTADNVVVTIDGEQVTVPSSGIASTEGILQSPGVADGEYGEEGRGKAVQYKYLPGSSGNVQVIVENPGIGGTGRQSWRQVR